VAQQNVKRIQVTTWLTEFSADVRALVRGACDEMLDAFLAANNIRADHKMTFMERSALRAECRRLTKFVRLADFVVRDTLLKLALDSAAALLQYIVPPPALMPPRIVRTDLPSTAVDEDADKAGRSSGLGLSFDAIVPAQGTKSKKHTVAAPMFVVEASFDAVANYVEQVVEDVAAAMAEGAILVTILGPSSAAAAAAGGGGVVESKDDDVSPAAASPTPSDVVEGESTCESMCESTCEWARLRRPPPSPPHHLCRIVQAPTMAAWVPRLVVAAVEAQRPPRPPPLGVVVLTHPCWSAASPCVAWCG